MLIDRKVESARQVLAADRASLLEATGRKLRRAQALAAENSPALDPNPTPSAAKRGSHVPSDPVRRI